MQKRLNKFLEIISKFYKFTKDEINYPLNIWLVIVYHSLLNFFAIFLFNTIFLNFVTDSNFLEGIFYSYIIFIFSILYYLISIFNPFQFVLFLYDTIVTFTDYILNKIIYFLK